VANYNSDVFFWTAAGFCALASGYTLARFLSFVRRDRFISDTPLAKIRSAPQGYVRLEGRAGPSPGEDSAAPLSGRPCVWWQYQIARRYRNAKGQTEWSTVDSRTSVAPFTLTDGDGQCLVGPVGADVTPTISDTWFGESEQPDGPPPAHRSLLTPEHEYRYSERLIAPGAQLSVLGEFRSQSATGDIDRQVQELLASWKHDQAALLSKFDRNHDGRIDGDEWEAARAAARAQVEATVLKSPTDRISCVAQTTHGEPFLIAPLDQQQLHRRERRFEAVSLLASVVFLVLAVWAVRRALSAAGA
jgi:hypothetical protein